MGSGVRGDERVRDAEVARLRVEISYDGGASWPRSYTVGMPGGDVMIPDPADEGSQIVSPESSITISLRQPESDERMVRAELLLREGLSTQVHVDVD